jgi:hypothetical protein
MSPNQRIKQAMAELSALELQAEQAYRRGFHQGAHIALRQVEQGHSERRLKTWLADVFNWRHNLRWVKNVYSNEHFKSCPPELPAPAKRADR